MLHQPHAVRLSALGLILAAGLLGGAAETRGDLWTPRPTPQAAPRQGAPATAPPVSPAAAAAAGAEALTVIAIVDPACPQSRSLLDALAAFRARHPAIAVEALLAAAPRRGAPAGAALVRLTEPGVPLAWAPERLRRLAPRALPAVYVLDARGRGVRAAGVPPLEELVRLAREAIR